MTPPRRASMRELRDADRAERRAETQVAIAEGRVTVRQMTTAEHQEADDRKAARDASRAGTPQRARY